MVPYIVHPNFELFLVEDLNLEDGMPCLSDKVRAAGVMTLKISMGRTYVGLALRIFDRSVRGLAQMELIGGLYFKSFADPYAALEFLFRLTYVASESGSVEVELARFLGAVRAENDPYRALRAS